MLSTDSLPTKTQWRALLSFSWKYECPARVHFHFLVAHFVACISCLVAKSCPTLCDPMDCSPLDPSVHGISQARVLEWVAIFLLQGIFSTQGSNQHLLLWEVSSLPLSQLGSKFVHISSSWRLVTDLYLDVQTCHRCLFIILLMDARAFWFLDIMEKNFCQHVCV